MEKGGARVGDERSHIAGAVSIMSSATLLSRVLGYLRDALIASYFGAGLAADAFFVAFRVSNLLRRLVGEGALTSAFVPVFTEVLERRSREEAARFVSGFYTLFFVVLVALAVAGIIFSEFLVGVMSPGFTEVPGKFELAVSLTRLMFPYMVFIGLMAASMGVLNSLRHFTAPAVSPIFFNISIILSTLILAPILKEPVYAIAWGVLIGGLLQFLVQVPFLKRFGMLPRPIILFGDPAVRKIMLLMAPALLGIGVYQLNVFVTMRFASMLSEGSISYLYYSSRLMELPLGVFAVSIATAVLPSLSLYAAKNDMDSLKGSLDFALRSTNFVTIPATVGLLVLSLPIIEVLFMRGEFGAEAAAETSYALFFYALGIVPIALTRILVSVFYSLKDTKTPVWVAFVTFIFNIIMCLALMGPLRHGGLALAATFSASLNFLCLIVILSRRLGHLEFAAVISSAWRCLIASLLMGLIVYGFIFYAQWQSLGMISRVALLCVTIPGGAVIYLLLCRAFKVPEVAFLKRIYDKRVGRKADKNLSNEESEE